MNVCSPKNIISLNFKIKSMSGRNTRNHFGRNEKNLK